MKVFIILLLFPVHSFAFSNDPEWMSYSPLSSTVLEGLLRTDSEYTSDHLTYSFPVEQQWQWLNSESALQYSLGSLSDKRFLHHARLKHNQVLSDNWQFYFRHHNEQDFDFNQSNTWVQFIYNLYRSFSVGFAGTTFSQKSDIDARVSLHWNPDTFNHLELYSIESDFMLNERNEESDIWLEPAKTYGLSYHYINNQDFLKLSARFDLMAKRYFPDEGELLAHKQRIVQVFKQIKLNRGLLFLGLEYNSRFEALDDEQSYRDSHEALLQWTSPLSEKNQFLYAIKYKSYLWQTNNFDLNHKNTLPHFTWLRNIGRDQLGLTYELSLHDASNATVNNANISCGNCTEHRMNILWNINFDQESVFRWLFTFDMDRFGQGDTWEGGSGQFYTTW